MAPNRPAKLRRFTLLERLLGAYSVQIQDVFDLPFKIFNPRLGRSALTRERTASHQCRNSDKRALKGSAILTYLKADAE